MSMDYTSIEEQTLRQLEAENLELQKDKERLDFLVSTGLKVEMGDGLFRVVSECAFYSAWERNPRVALDAAKERFVGNGPICFINPVPKPTKRK